LSAAGASRATVLDELTRFTKELTAAAHKEQVGH
jgi:hypothetical protein